jgi:hypothetical protein
MLLCAAAHARFRPCDCSARAGQESGAQAHRGHREGSAWPRAPRSPATQSATRTAAPVLLPFLCAPPSFAAVAQRCGAAWLREIGSGMRARTRARGQRSARARRRLRRVAAARRQGPLDRQVLHCGAPWIVIGVRAHKPFQWPRALMHGSFWGPKDPFSSVALFTRGGRAAAGRARAARPSIPSFPACFALLCEGLRDDWDRIGIGPALPRFAVLPRTAGAGSSARQAAAPLRQAVSFHGHAPPSAANAMNPAPQRRHP